MTEAETIAYLFRKAGQRLEGCEGLLEVDRPHGARADRVRARRVPGGQHAGRGGTLKLKNLGHLAHWVADMMESAQ